jgi:hypothetical protein
MKLKSTKLKSQNFNTEASKFTLSVNSYINLQGLRPLELNPLHSK